MGAPCALDVTVTCRDVAVSRWYFEEVATFLEVTGALVFWVIKDDPRLPPHMLEMWTHLRSYAMYFLYYRKGQHTTSQARKAQNHLIAFARFAETKMQGRLCSVLLHRAAVHVPGQVLDALPGAFMREDFGERSIRTTKHKITHAATRNAAKASADCCLLEMCMRRLKRQHPDIDAPLQRFQGSKRARRTDAGGVDGVQLHQMRDAYSGEDNDEVPCHCP